MVCILFCGNGNANITKLRKKKEEENDSEESFVKRAVLTVYCAPFENFAFTSPLLKCIEWTMRKPQREREKSKK